VPKSLPEPVPKNGLDTVQKNEPEAVLISGPDTVQKCGSIDCAKEETWPRLCPRETRTCAKDATHMDWN
jgi:hypothetical protein